MRTSHSRQAGANLVEMMIALSVFIVGGSVAFPLLSGDIGLYARNFSINKSDNSLRYSVQMLKRDIDMSIEPPILASYSVTNGVGSFTPLATTATSAQAFIAWVNLGPAYKMLPASGNYINPNSSITLQRHTPADSTAADAEAPTAPLPKVGDRLLIMSPSPYGTGMAESVTINGVTIQKPGRRITSVTPGAGNNFTITLDLSNTSLPANIPGNNSVFLVREVAYAAYTVTGAGGAAVERQLLYYPTTATLTNPMVLIRDLDPIPQEIDTNTGAVVQPFNYYAGRGTLSPMSVNLPIRAVDYAHAIGDRNLGGQATGTSTSEFNLFLRSNPTMGVKNRLDDDALTQIQLN